MSTRDKMFERLSDQHSSDLVLFAELKPRLSVVHTVLHIPKVRYEKGTTIKVLKSHIEVIQKADDSAKDCDNVRTIVLQNLSLIPASCHGLKWVPGDGMHFRMQICRQEEGEENMALPNKNKPVPAEERLAPFRSVPHISCKMCGQAILHRSFSRVRSLPSEDWQELADQMFCHPHRDDVPDCQPLAPSRGDCFVSDRHLVVHGDDLMWKGILKGAKQTLHCQRCKIIIGKQIELVNATFVQLSIHYLNVRTDSLLDTPVDKLSRTQKMESWFADFLLTETTTHNSCRLLVEAETDAAKTSPYILLWVLESNVVLYTGAAPTQEEPPGQGEVRHSTAQQHAVQNSTEHADRVDDSSVQRDVTEGGTIHNGVENQNAALRLQPQPILKVLYRDCVREKNKGFGKQWREDFTVHSVTLPHDLCKQMLLMLVESSKLLPRSLQSANGFYVGFLRKKEKL